jgi:photosystem II stability/assembly factor-like uncharacterized protein
MRPLQFLLLALVARTLLAPGAVAQPLPDRLEWELVDSVVPTGLDSLAVIDGVAFLGDTLIATGKRSVWAYDAVANAWIDRRAGSLPFPTSGPITSGEALGMSGDPAPLFLYRSGNVFRSADGGRSWDEVLEPATSLPMRTPSGRLVVGHNGLIETGEMVAFSDDEGRTWQTGTYFPGAAGVPKEFATLPPSAEHPQGRLVAADFSGVAYSTDDGETWQRSSLSGPYRSDGIDVVAAGPRSGGRAGRLVAGATDFTRNRSYVYTSDDGGATWTERFAYPLEGERRLYVEAAPDGAVYMYNDRYDHANHLFGSADGGETWRDLGPMGAEWPFGAAQLIIGPDGRLYVGGPDGVPAYNPMEDEAAGGVFRTVNPVVSTASDPAPRVEPSGLGLRVFPNPASGAMTVSLSGHAPGEVVRVAVYDVLGREVAVLHDGLARAGQRFPVDPGRLASGLYLARAVTASDVATERITVSR